MISVSIPYKRLCGEKNVPFEDLNGFLKKLKESDVRNIELRSISRKDDAQKVYEVAKNIWNHGMTVTVHGHVHTQETAIDDVFGPLAELLRDFRQKELIVTIHPTLYDNVSILTELSDYISENNFPVRIALENNRFLPDKTRGDCIGFTLGIVEKVNRQNVGICFDMGHNYYNSLIDSPEDPAVLPLKAFLKRVIHTHIHALSKDRATHFPFYADNDLPLKEYLEALAHNYFGVYNIEIDYQKFADIYDVEKAWLDSIEAVKDAMPFCGRFYDDIRDNFKERMKRSADVLRGDKNGFSLVHSSSYLFNINGIRWAVDFALRTAGELSDSFGELPELLSGIRFMLITHGHDDHFEPKTVEMLKNTDIKWVIPHFMTETALRCGIKKENIITAYENEMITLDGFNILPFEGKHFRKTNGEGTESLGYYVTAKNSPSLLFLGDVRDYTKGNISIDGEVDYLFSHVWLGDSGAGDETLHGEIPHEFTQYMLSFEPKNIVLAHLYESGRSESDMWKICHAKALSELFAKENENIRIHIPLTGDTVNF